MTEAEYRKAEDTIAAGLAKHRFANNYGPWERFQINHPDLAEIYRANAAAAVKSLRDAGFSINPERQ